MNQVFQHEQTELETSGNRPTFRLVELDVNVHVHVAVVTALAPRVRAEYADPPFTE